MFGLGVTEVLIIVLVAVLVFGPDQLPKVVKQLGQGMREFKRTTSDLQGKLEEAVWESEDEEREREKAAKQTPLLRPAEGSEARASNKAPADDDQGPAPQS